MKSLVLGLALLFSLSVVGQELNLKKGFMAEGYDVVSYFSDDPKKGDDAFVYEHDGAKYKFSSQTNLDTFKSDPEKYIPMYGGWCAYAMGDTGDKVDINPKTYEIIDGKLYLFYNSFGINTLEKWNEEGAEELKKKADENWGKLGKK